MFDRRPCSQDPCESENRDTRPQGEARHRLDWPFRQIGAILKVIDTLGAWGRLLG
jgi:hypothetical protein